MKDVHCIDPARQAAVSQCAAMAERIDELEAVVYEWCNRRAWRGLFEH